MKGLALWLLAATSATDRSVRTKTRSKATKASNVSSPWRTATARIARLASSAEVQTFTESEAIEALDHIIRTRPAIVAMQDEFADTSRGQALINRIKDDAALATVEGQAVMTVTDNGPGVPAELQPQIFERFTRADTSRVRARSAAQGGSTGLGLAIVAAVVEAHHGQVTVESHPGYTRFTVTLPTVGAPATGRGVPARIG